jgi:hypothetical protein
MTIISTTKLAEEETGVSKGESMSNKWEGRRQGEGDSGHLCLR